MLTRRRALRGFFAGFALLPIACAGDDLGQSSGGTGGDGSTGSTGASRLHARRRAC